MSIVTFLFTDIEGSTRRWEADADAMRVALEAHNKVLREAIDANDGSVFNYTGDGMCAVFASPRSAVDAAVDAQRALELPVRMGIATGEAELRGDDYFGTVLNRTARVMAAGHGGQILLDGATAALLSGVDLIVLGTRRLRDIAKPVDVFQVQAAGLPTGFPPLKTVDPTPGNLRSPTTSIIGREAELVEVETALKSHRLVTLTGVGGVGKTRLALEVAARLATAFSDGVWVIELAAVGDPDAVPGAVAAALGITQQPGMSVLDGVATTLEGRARLLIMDNCEHVLDAAADMIEAILGRSATVKILATSREGLRVVDEQLWRVPSLDVDTFALDLFVERARGVAPALSLTDGHEASAIIEICRRLDGLPLAIELAASRMVSMTAVELRDRLDHRFRMLVGSRRGLERHQTLRHAVQWSYDLLDVAEMNLLNRCSVFAGGFDVAGACAVAASDDDYATLDLLDALVRKSLLVTDRSSGRTRYSMLETIRQFAEEQLASTDEATHTRNAHARYFANKEAEVLALWDSARQREAYAWFTVELANLRSAFRWAAYHDDLDTAATIASYAASVGSRVEQYEPVGWAEELLGPTKAVGHRRLAQLYAMASLCNLAGRTEDALGYSEHAQAAIESGRFDPVPHESEAFLGGPYLSIGRPQGWIDWSRNVIARASGAAIYARACLVLALTSADRGDEAITASDGLLTAAEAADNPHTLCWALLTLGVAYRDVDQAAAAVALRRGLEIAQESGNRQIVSNLAAALARLAATHGEPMDAFDPLILAIRNQYDSGSFSLLRSPLAVLAALFDRLGHYEPASTIAEFAATPLARATQPQIDTAITHLRHVLGDKAYQEFAHTGRTMTNAEMIAYAFEQIDLARAELQ
jgi:predicted ATPase